MRILSACFGVLICVAHVQAQTVVFDHDFTNATPGSLDDGGALGTPIAGSITATGGFIGEPDADGDARMAYTTGTNGAFNAITPVAGEAFDDVGTPAGNFVTIELESPVAITGGLSAGETTEVSFSLGSFGSNNQTNFKYIHVIGLSSSGDEVFQLLWRAGSGAIARQLYAREFDENNTVFDVDSTFSSVEGSLVLDNVGFALNSTNTAVRPFFILTVNVVIDDVGWNASAIPTSGGSTQSDVTGLSIDSGATNLASVVFFTSHNQLVNNENKGLWLEDVLVSSSVVVAGSLLGDVNLDGTVDLLDVAPFVDLLLNGGFQTEADLNSDGVVDLLDVAPFVELLLG